MVFFSTFKWGIRLKIGVSMGEGGGLKRMNVSGSRRGGKLTPRHPPSSITVRGGAVLICPPPLETDECLGGERLS